MHQILEVTTIKSNQEVLGHMSGDQSMPTTINFSASNPVIMFSKTSAMACKWISPKSTLPSMSFAKINLC